MLKDYQVEISEKEYMDAVRNGKQFGFGFDTESKKFYKADLKSKAYKEHTKAKNKERAERQRAKVQKAAQKKVLKMDKINAKIQKLEASKKKL